ncbi:GAF domain-containing sensor histidine kinase [Nocardia alni]|uniref:GAF domain-containing sensor histidine kinase n=1 Tax=Nocardia alni TaxID=2815723 RepID=UPI001C24E955|nr:GAF domain-containing protein [Nocardia alni]
MSALNSVSADTVDDVRALRFVQTARGILGAQTVTLSDRHAIVACCGLPTGLSSPAPVDGSRLCADFPLQHYRSRDVTVATVSSGADGRYTLTAEWTYTPVVERHVAVAFRALARLAAAAVDNTRPAEQCLIVAGGHILAELALTVESIEELLGGVTAALGALVDGTSAGVSVLNDRNILQVLPGSFGASGDLVAAAVVQRTDVATSTAEVFRSGETMLSNHPEVEIPRFPEWYAAFRVERLITLPINVGGERLGVVHVANRPTAFTWRHAHLAERLTPFIASAVAQVRQRLEMKQREELVATVGRAAAAIASGRGLGEIEPFLDELRVVLSCVSAVVAYRETGHRAITGDPESVESVTGFLKGIDAESSGLRSAMYRPALPGEFGWVSIQVPITVDGEVRATLALLRTPWLPFRRHERNAARRMAETIALGWTTDRYLREQAETARMKERLRIADDIHDRVAQLLFAGKLSLQSLEEFFEREMPANHPGSLEVRRALDLMERSDYEVRQVINHLAAAADPGRSLCEELLATVAEVELQFGIEIGVDLPDGDDLPELGARASAALLAAGREAMINAAKHAGPCTISATLTRRIPDRVILRVSDDGVGLGGAAPGYGLTSTRRKLTEQSASMVLKPGPAGGVEVIIEMPGKRRQLA